MAFADEIIKHQRQRSVYVDFSSVNNPGIAWEGEVSRLYGTAYDDLGPVPIKGTVTSFGTFARSVLNMELSLETPSVTIELIDDNNEWRVLAEPPSDLLIYRWVHLMMRVLDDNGGYFDHRVAVGQIVDPVFPAGKKVSLSIQLSPGSFMGESLPRRLITMRDFPRCPPENVGKVVPVIYGVMSNAVRTATVGGGSVLGGCASTASLVFSSNWENGTKQDTWDALTNSSATEITAVGPEGSNALLRTVGGVNPVLAVTLDPIPEGCMEWWYQEDRLTSESTLLTLRQLVSGEAWLTVTRNIGGDGTLGLYILGEGITGSQNIFSQANVFRLDQLRQFRLEWKLGTYQGGGTWASDGFVRFYADGALIANVTGLAWHAAAVAPEGGLSTINLTVLGALDEVQVRNGTVTVVQNDAFCTPTDTGTGPNMAAGAVRALLVDTGITTSISVSTPAPEPGTLEIDETIEQMGGITTNEGIGSGLITEPTWYFAAPIVNGRIGPLSNISDLDQSFDPDYPAHTGVVSWNDLTTGTPDQWIVWMFTDFNFHPVSNPEPGARVKIIPGTPYTDPDWPPANTFDYQVIFTSLDDGDPWEPFPTMPDTTTTTAFTGYRYLLAGHTLHRVNEVYVRRPVPVPAAVEGEDPTTVEMQVLQQEGTDYIQEVIEVNGSRYHTLRFFAAQQSDDCTQQYEVTANLEGVETNGDGTGELITNGIEMVEHILLNWVFNNYRSSTGPYAPEGGRWFTDVPYAPGLLDHASFIAAYEAAFTLVTGGYLGSGMMVEQQSGESLLNDLMRSFGLDFYFDSTSISSPGNGAWAVQLFIPENVTRASLVELRPDPPNESGLYMGINAGTFNLRFARNAQRNVVPYLAGPMYGRLSASGTNEDGGYTVSGEIRDTESIDRFGLIPNDPLILPWTRDPETAYSVAFRYLLLVRYPPIYADLQTPIGAVLYPPSTAVKVSHPDGTGLLGWSGRVCRIYRADIDLGAMTMSLSLRDVDALVP